MPGLVIHMYILDVRTKATADCRDVAVCRVLQASQDGTRRPAMKQNQNYFRNKDYY